MLKAIIVDDELDAIKNLKWEIEQFCTEVEVCDSFTKPVEAISAINYLKPDCVFLDIEMPEIDGFKLLDSLIYRDFDLIITTAYDNYAVRAFKENAIDYLLKPIDSDDLIRAVKKVKKNKAGNVLGFDLNHVINTILPQSSNSRVPLPLVGKTVFVDRDSILYCKSEGNYTEIFFKNGDKELVSRNLKLIEELINDKGFYRVHNSYLVHLKYVKEFIKSDGQYLVLDDATTVPISRQKRVELHNLLNY